MTENLLLDHISPTRTSSSSDVGESLEEICLNNGINPRKIKQKGQEVTDLELFFNGFSNLSTLSYFPNLTKLVVFGSELTDLDQMEYCFQLTELWLCETCLNRIPDLSKCLNIERLYLYQNNLKAIENLEPLKNLKVLNLASNRLTNLAGIETSPGLTELNIAGNSLQEIGHEITYLKHLEKLNVSGNKFESVIQLYPLRVLNLKEFLIGDKLYPRAPLCNLTNYTLQIIYSLQSLEKLNGEIVPREAVQEAIQIIRRKVIYYNMKNRIQKRSIYKFLKAIRNLSQTRLKVPKEAIKNLQAELKRLQPLIMSNEIKPIQKAAVNHKLSQLDGRLNYWKEFHRKLKREQRNALNTVINKFKFNENMIELELLSGGNIRFEEIKVDSDQGENDYFNLCEKLVQDNCSGTRKTALGLEAIQISRVTRVYNKLRRNTFDSKIDQLTNSDSQQPLDQSYCFIVCDPSKNSELVSIVENNKIDIVATSPLDADLRFHKNYNSSFPPSTTHLVLCRVYLGRCLPVRGELNKAKMNDQQVDSFYEETLNGRKFRILNGEYILPEFILELEFIPKPRAFPPLIFHIDLQTGTSQSQFTPRPTQEQEDRDFEVLNSNPKTEVLNLVSKMQTVSQTITELNLTGLGLDYLPSLTSFQQLETVDLSCNQITEVRTSWVTPKTLASINLSHNNIEKFQIAPKPNLTNLNLSWNLMINLSNLLEDLSKKTPKLETIDLRSNFFIEDEDQETKSCMSVSSYCISKLPYLTTCHGITLDRDQLTPVELNDELMMDRGRDGDPDRCLRLLNSSQYLYEYPPTQKIPLDQITSICMDGMGISDIQPLEALHQLKYISLCNNNITNLAPLNSAVNLIEVHCNQNKVKNINSEWIQSHHLKIIDLSKNVITELNLSPKAKLLSILDLSCNQIKTINTITRFKQLKQLFIADNAIEDLNEIIQLKNCESLEILDICDNPFQDKIDGDPRLYTLFHFPILKALNGIPIENKDITSAREHFGGRLTVDYLAERFGYDTGGKVSVDLSQISQLDLQDCDIRSVHLTEGVLSNLTSLNMVENNLQHFSGIISLKNLVTLCLNKNNIESVFPLTKPQRAQMTRSQYSQRTNNSDIDLLHYQEESPILPKLEVLHLGFNKIKDMTLLNLNRFPVLKSLFLESNEITKIDGLENCHEIRHLVLDRNRIKDIEAGALIGQWRLEELHIDGNRLTSLGNLRHLVNLKRLYIGLNRIQEIAEISKLSALQNLTEISMIGNGVARRMLHRPMLVWQCPSLHSIDGIRVDLPERQNAEFYFMEKGHEPVFPQLDSLQPTPPMATEETIHDSKYRAGQPGAWPDKQPSSKGAYQKNWNNNMKH